MNKLLFLPGILFLLVIFFRVFLPMIKNPAWKRALNNARYERSRKKMEKSDSILKKAISSYPNQPEVYLEFYLNHSKSTDLKERFDALYKGWENTKDTTLAFFIGSAYLEEGILDKAEEFLEMPAVHDYVKAQHIFLHPQLYIDQKRWEDAEKSFWDFHNLTKADKKERMSSLSEMSALDVIPLITILKAQNKNWQEVMQLIPVKSFHSTMSWVDLRAQFKENLSTLQKAKTGIHGSPENFNRRRKSFFQERLDMVEDWIKLSKVKS